jgi:hypothetical protein
MKKINKHIVGTWRLVHSISIDSNGHTEYPHGQDAIVREIQVTDEEWEFAWDFMGRIERARSLGGTAMGSLSEFLKPKGVVVKLG